MASVGLPMKKYPLIDLVRSFCILSVLAIHSDIAFLRPTQPWANWLWDHFQRNGIYGVRLFFTVSGFLITGVLAHNPGSLSKPDLKVFYLQRAGRILPLWSVMIWTGLCLSRIPYDPHLDYLDVFHPESGFLTPGFWLSIVTFTFNAFLAFHPSMAYGLYWTILWSLSVEEQFYLLFPLLLRRLHQPEKLPWLAMGFIGLGPLWRWILYAEASANRYLQTGLLFGAFDSIAWGVLLFTLRERWKDQLSEKIKWALFLAGFTILTIVYLGTDLNAQAQILEPSFLALGLVLLLWGGLDLNFFASPWLRPLGWPGKYCYGGYLLHPLIFSVFFPVLFKMSAWWGILLFGTLTTLVGAVSYHLFEMPANKTIRALKKI